jgi:hypothetical protein
VRSPLELSVSSTMHKDMYSQDVDIHSGLLS